MKKRTETTNRLLRVLAVGCTLSLLLGAAGSIAIHASQEEEKEAQFAYQQAMRMLDDGQYREAAAAFREALALERELAARDRELVAQRPERADAALYWQGYALSKMGAYDRAIAVYEELRHSYPASAWLDDADALQMEMLASAREGAEIGEDEELKLLALQSLTHSDSDRAVPLLQKFLQGERSAPAKERALFLLMQTGAPEALDAAADIARNESDHRLRISTLQHIGILGGEPGFELLSEIYASTDEAEIKDAILHGFMAAGRKKRLLEAAENEEAITLRRTAVQMLGTMGAEKELQALMLEERSEEVRRAILEAFMISGDKQLVLDAARNESSVELRRSAIQLLAVMDAKDEVWELFRNEPDVELRVAILESMAITGDTARLAEVAGEGADPRIRVAAIRALGLAGERASTDTLLSIYESAADSEVRAAALEGFMAQGDVDSLIRIARSESDRRLRAHAIHYLAMMDSEKAREYLEEFLAE